MTSVDVIVTNYRTPADLSGFCQSMADQEYSTLTIVNNDPWDIDRVVATHHEQELGAYVIENEENIGYARAVNAAARELRSDYLAIFNADVVCPPGSVQAMCTFMEQYPRVGIAGPKQVNGQNQITHAGIMGTNVKPRLRGWKERDNGQYDDVFTNIVSVSGSAYFVKRACWDELTACEAYQQGVKEYTGDHADGAFLPTQFYWEETFCSYHARAHDWTVAYNGQVCMVHQHMGAGGVSSRVTKESQNFFRFVCDHHRLKHD